MSNSTSAPKWVWLFVGVCLLIPLVALGGAIPGALGAGGAAACYSISKQDRTTTSRMGLCVLTTVVCWGLFAFLVSQIR